MDPFYAECRAYGKMQRSTAVIRKKSAQIAVPCHGYILLKDQDKKLLMKRGINLEIPNQVYQETAPENCSVRAIVKDYIPGGSGFTNTTISSIEKGIAFLNGLGIYNMDISLQNFRGGRIVDFGLSYTEPHALLDAQDSDAQNTSRISDRYSLERMAEEEGIDATANFRKMHSMRRRSRRISEPAGDTIIDHENTLSNGLSLFRYAAPQNLEPRPNTSSCVELSSPHRKGKG